ncbi:MAG: tetratricopeptide repeat protein, partial [Candidatus Eisenbacteria bacterium]|nr:tetratricopeptide repeat protein [Candidatus Eisenbacteria bacterium]
PQVRGAVVDLEIHRAEATPLHATAFRLDGAGLVTCRRLVAGADWVAARTGSAQEERITRYLADDPAADLVILDAPEGPALETGASGLLARAQGVFVAAPPRHPAPIERLSYWRGFEAAGFGQMLAIRPQSETLAADLSGAPLLDSLGLAVGVVELFPHAGGLVGVAIPIRRVGEMMAQPDVGGALADLDPAAQAPWTRSGTPAHAQVLGGALLRAGQREAGTALLEQALEADSTLVAALIELGMSHQMRGEYAAAESLYEQALARDPNASTAHLYLGSCLFMQGIYLQSQYAYERAIDADPDRAMPYVNLAGAFVQQGKPEEGERVLREALTLEPELGIAHNNLGVILYTAGRVDEAAEILDYLRQRRSGYATRLHRQTFGRSAR